MGGVVAFRILLLVSACCAQNMDLAELTRRLLGPARQFARYVPPPPLPLARAGELSLIDGESSEIFVNENPTGCMCSRVYEPVCGTDEKTYRNRCELECRVASLADTAGDPETPALGIQYVGKCVPF